MAPATDTVQVTNGLAGTASVIEGGSSALAPKVQYYQAIVSNSVLDQIS